MADQVDAIIRLRRGRDSERRGITFESGEVGFSTDVKRAFIGDGTTKGGNLLGNQNTIAAAAIVGTKVPNPSAIQYDIYYDKFSCITYMLSNDSGPDFINNYAVISPLADENSLIYRNGRFAINPLYFNDPKTGYVHLSGDTMAGYLTLNALPISAFHATPKLYVDNGLTALSAKIVKYVTTGADGSGSPPSNGGYVHLSGDTMKGPETLKLYKDPKDPMDAVNKKYLEDTFISKPTIVKDKNILVYDSAKTAWVAGFGTNDFIETNVRTLPTTETTSVLTLTDSNNIVVFTAPGACSCQVPLNTIGHRIGTQIIVIQKGTGKITFSGVAGVTILSNSNRFKTIGQYSGAVLIKLTDNEWFLGGDVTQ